MPLPIPIMKKMPDVPKSTDGQSKSAVRIKPRRPYTPYNLFYLLERELIVQEIDPQVAKEKAAKRASMLADPNRKKVVRPEDDIELPTRYKGCILLPHWYEPNLKEKRKHRKTHGKISFKDLTGMISKNWATIDKETKDYCTKISDMGRKQYKETMIRYNSSQKIIQMKEEHDAKKRMEQPTFKMVTKAKVCNSPTSTLPSIGKGKKKSNPVTPDRSASQHHAPIVNSSSSRSGYNPMQIPSGAHAAFFQYGPPPPLPPSMPMSQPMQHGHSMQGQIPRSMMQMYQQHHQKQQRQHHHQHQHPQQQRQHEAPQQRKFKYPQAPVVNKVNHNRGQQQFNQSSMQMNNKNRQYDQAIRGGGNSSKYVPNNRPTNNGGGTNVNVHVPNTPGATSVNLSVNVVHVSKDDSSNDDTAHSDKMSMSHEEAMRLCAVMESPGKKSQYLDSPGKKGQYEAPLNDSLLQEMPSFDFADHHSLSTDDDDISDRLDVDHLLDEVGHDDNIMNLISHSLLHDEDASFPDIRFAM